MPENTAAAGTRGQAVELIVASEQAGERLDRFVASQLSPMSRARVQTLIEQGRVEIDGAGMKPSYRVQPGETVIVRVPPPPPAGVQAEQIALDILYEDEDIAVVNKPAGMIVHPGAGAREGTLVAALLARFAGITGLSGVGGPLRPGIVHRLDRGTSGAVLVARTDAAHRKLVDAFRDRLVEKTYVSLLHGRIKGASGAIDLPVARDLRRRFRMTARRREGREAHTSWRARLRLGGFTLIEAALHTGRTHQIRVHASALGCPVVGDTLYGAPLQERIGSELLPPLGRNFLHALRLAFAHPRSGERIVVRAPLAPELEDYLKLVGRATQTDPTLVDAALQEFL